jgi:hypothetical protein
MNTRQLLSDRAIHQKLLQTTPVSSKRTLEDLVDGHGGVVGHGFLQEQDLETIRSQCLLQEGYQRWRNSVRMYLLQVEAILKLDVTAADGQSAAFLRRRIRGASRVRVGRRLRPWRERPPERFPKLFMVDAVEKGERGEARPVDGTLQDWHRQRNSFQFQVLESKCMI